MSESFSTIAAPLRLNRRLQAPAHEVFRCFTSAALLERWFAPRSDFRVLGARAEAHVGGRLEVDIALPDGSQGSFSGRFHNVEAPRQLVFDLGVVLAAGPGPVTGALIEVDLEPDGTETELEMRLHLAEGQPLADLYREAMTAMLGRLPLALEGFVDRFVERVSRFPRYRSRFGGLWPDLSDAEGRIDGKLELGLLSETEAALFRAWCRQGYLHLPGAVAEDDIRRFETDLEELWAEPDPEIRVECCRDGQFGFEAMSRDHRAMPHKVLDIHGRSASARDLIFSAPILDFVEKLFERPALAFQSLLFERGTGQSMHQDTAFVGLSSPMEFVGVWIALEDIRPGSGELCYYEGSHEIDEYLWLGRSKVKPYGYMDEDEFFRWVIERSEERGLEKRRFLARRGDALIWHADLVHGGSPDPDPALTRRSLVSHLCPVDVDPEYMVRDPDHRRRRHGERGYWSQMNRG